VSWRFNRLLNRLHDPRTAAAKNPPLPTLFTSYQWDVFGEITQQSDQTGAGSTVQNTYDLLVG
jgi:hypothetical protein